MDAKAVTDGDTITVYVSMARHPESSNVPQDVYEAGIERSKALAANNYQRAGDLLKIILDAGYRSLKKKKFSTTKWPSFSYVISDTFEFLFLGVGRFVALVGNKFLQRITG